MELEAEDEVLDYQDVPVKAVGEIQADVLCYRTDAEPMMVILQHVSGDDPLRLTTHNGDGTEVHLCPVGESIIAWHQADQEPQVSVVVTGGGSGPCDARLVMV